MALQLQTTDVAIIGGGPAGTTAGVQLSRAGLRVAIIEKEKFPRFCVGESLLPYGNDILKQLGIWDKLESAGYMRKYGAEFRTGDSSRTLRFWFNQNLDANHEYTFQVDRASFDKLLLDHAREQGCDVREQTRVTALENANKENMQLQCDGPDGSYLLNTRWVIDASGRCAFAGARAGLRRCPTLRSKRVAIYGHFEGVMRNSGKAEGHITIVRLFDSWFWFIPLANNRASVGLVVPSERAAVAGSKGIDEMFREAVENSPEATDRLATAKPVTPLSVTGDYSWRFSSFATQRVLLIGDAAGFIDPVFSSGVTLALKSGMLASELVASADALGRSLSLSEQAGYTRKVVRWMNQYAKVIRMFYSTAGFEVFMNPSPFLGIPKSIGRLVGGDTMLGTLDRMRLAVFRLICRTQNILQFAPSIPSLR